MDATTTEALKVNNGATEESTPPPLPPIFGEENATRAKSEESFPRKIFSLTYTFRGDAIKAAICDTLIPLEWERVWVVESRDADMPVPENVRVVVRDFDRGRQLRHGNAILGMREVFVECADCMREGDILVKVDSDTALFRPNAFIAPITECDIDFVYIRRNFNEGRVLANGCCYSMARRALDAFRTLPVRHLVGITKKFDGHEDRVFSSFINCEMPHLTSCGLDKKKFHWNYKNNWDSDIFAAHYGYIKSNECFDILVKHCKLTNTPLPNVGKIRDFLVRFQRWALENSKRESEKNAQGN